MFVWPRFKLCACLFCAFDLSSNYLHVCLTKVQSICMFVLCIWPRFILFACLFCAFTKAQTIYMFVWPRFKLCACLLCAFDQSSNYLHVCLTKGQTICMSVLHIWPKFKLFACLSKISTLCQRLSMKKFTDSQYGFCPLVWMFRGRNGNLTIIHINDG